VDDGVYEIREPDVFTFAAVGHTSKLLNELSMKPELLNSLDEMNRSLLYHTSRSGFYETTEALLKRDAEIDQKQAGGSTPLHGAAYYGQSSIVKLLLIYGADTSIKNVSGNTPADEASSPETKQAFEDHVEDAVSKIISTLFRTGFAEDEVYDIKYGDDIIAREVPRNRKLLNKRTSYQSDMIHQHWKLAFHGTKQDNSKSILECGLLKSGSTTRTGDKIEPPRGHIELGTTLSGIENWAGAVFASPSILYASEPAYSERIEGLDGSKWCFVIKVLVNPLSFDTHVSTTSRRIPPVRGEPDGIEYRCKESSAAADLSIIWRLLHTGHSIMILRQVGMLL
jgi:hypothetical protein